VRPQAGDAAGAVERDAAGDRAVREATEAVDVGATVDRPPLDLLRRDVVDRAEQLARVREARRRVEHLRETEVGEVDLTGVGDHDVRGLDVAVDEPSVVCGVQRVGDVADDLDGALDGERPEIGQQLVEVAAVDPQHRQVEVAVVLAGLVDRHDARMVDPRDELSLTQQALAVLLVQCAHRRDHLERGRLARLGVRGAVDHAHSAGARNTLDAVPAEDRSHSEHPGTSRRRARLASKLDSVASDPPGGSTLAPGRHHGGSGSIAGRRAMGKQDWC
jgi:hypothetical protein